MKPDGQFTLGPDVATIMDFVATLPIRKVCGIGKVSSQDTLAAMHFYTAEWAQTSAFAVSQHHMQLPDLPVLWDGSGNPPVAHLPEFCADRRVPSRSPSRC